MKIDLVLYEHLHKAELHTVYTFFTFFCLRILYDLTERFVQCWIEKGQIMKFDFATKHVFQHMSLEEQRKQFVL